MMDLLSQRIILDQIDILTVIILGGWMCYVLIALPYIGWMNDWADHLYEIRILEHVVTRERLSYHL